MKGWIGILLAVVIYTQTGPVKLAWDHSNPAEVDHFEVRLIRDQTLEERNYGTIYQTITIPRPRSGVWEIKVRAVRKETDGTMTPSVWCSSLNLRVDKDGKVILCGLPCECARLKDGANGAWKIFWKPTTPIIMTVD